MKSIEREPEGADVQGVVQCLNEGGVASVFPRLQTLPMKSEAGEIWEFPTFTIPIVRDPSIVVQQQVHITQCLLDAGYRDFRSVLQLSSNHSLH